MKVVAVMVCPVCGVWEDVPYWALDLIECRGDPWLFEKCGHKPRVAPAMQHAAAIPDPADGRYYDLWLDLQPPAPDFNYYRYAAADVRPVLEGLL